MSRGIYLKYLRPILAMCPEGSVISSDDILNILKSYKGSPNNRYVYNSANIGSIREITAVLNRRKDCRKCIERIGPKKYRIKIGAKEIFNKEIKPDHWVEI